MGSPSQILLAVALVCFFVGAVWGIAPQQPNSRWGNANIISLGLFFLGLSLMVGR